MEQQAFNIETDDPSKNSNSILMKIIKLVTLAVVLYVIIFFLRTNMLLSNEHKTRNNTAAIKTLSLSNRHHILLIDDDEIFIFLTRKMLQSLGIVNNISVCRSATEAINYLHQNKGKNVDPDIIFLDLNMPGNDIKWCKLYDASISVYDKMC